MSRGLIEESTPRPEELPQEALIADVSAPRATGRVGRSTSRFSPASLWRCSRSGPFKFQSKNPLNVLTLPPRRVPLVDGFKKSLSLLKLRRIAEGVDSYTLLSGRLPETVETLVSSHILAAGDLKDPWGATYRYIVRDEKFYLVGFDALGHTDPDLLFSRTVVLRDTKRDDIQPRSPKEIIIVE